MLSMSAETAACTLTPAQFVRWVGSLKQTLPCCPSSTLQMEDSTWAGGVLPDFYSVLDIAESASNADIKGAFAMHVWVGGLRPRPKPLHVLSTCKRAQIPPRQTRPAGKRRTTVCCICPHKDAAAGKERLAGQRPACCLRRRAGTAQGSGQLPRPAAALRRVQLHGHRSRHGSGLGGLDPRGH